MPTDDHKPRFIPLLAASQNSHKNVLYYDSEVSLDAILECANARHDICIDLLTVLHEYNDASTDTVITICEASKLLLSDSKLLVTAFKGKQ